MLSTKLRTLVRQQWAGLIALFIALSGSAYAATKVGAGDIARNAIHSKHIKRNAVKTAKMKKSAVKTSKLADKAVKSSKVANRSLRGADVKKNSLNAAHIDESTLEVGAFGHLDPHGCSGTPVTCQPLESQGISSILRVATGRYCVIAPGIDADETSAVVSVEWVGTSAPQGETSAMPYNDIQCGGNNGFTVMTVRKNSLANDVGFTILIP